MTKSYMREKLWGFRGRIFAKVFPMNALSNGSTFIAYVAKKPQMFS